MQSKLLEWIAAATEEYISARNNWYNNYHRPDKAPELKLRCETAYRVMDRLIREWIATRGRPSTPPGDRA